MKVFLIDNPSWRSGLITSLVLIACGAIALPMLPIWQGAIRLLAGVVLITLLDSTLKQNLLFALFTILVTTSLGFWLLSLIEHPSSHVIHALTDVYGQPLGGIPDSAILLYDVLCVFGLSQIAIMRTWKTDRMVALFSLCLVMFWAWALLSSIVFILRNSELESISQAVTGVSLWATWVYWAVITILLVRNEEDVRSILRYAGIGGMFVCFVIAIQWLIGDYSYALDAVKFEDYFYRVRGTAYYHTPATFSLILTSGVILALVRKGSANTLWLVSSVVLLIVMITLNNSRAMSLAFLSGLVVVGLGSIRQKNHTLIILAFLGCIVTSTGIFYVKPISGYTEMQPVQEQVQEPEKIEEEVDFDEVIEANSSRGVLFLAGLHMLPSVAWFGSGIGTLELPLLGNSFNGLRSTYSTHTLYLDIPLMAGIPALLAFLMIFGISMWRVINNGIMNIYEGNSYRSPALLACLVMFGIGCLFLPQERNELIGIAFLLSALAVLKPENPEGAFVADNNIIKRWAITLIGVGVIGWSILVSPAYVFPVIEFIARHGQSIKDNNEQVVVTDPVIKPLIEAALYFRGVHQPNVHVLQDSVDSLPIEKTWLLWSSKNDYKYPHLRQALGYQRFRQGGNAPSLHLPPNWWVLPSSQPMINFVYIGVRSDISVPLQEIANIISVEGAQQSTFKEGGQEPVYSILKKNADWEVGLKSDFLLPFWLSIEPKLLENDTQSMDPIILKVANKNQLMSNLRLDADNLQPGMDVVLKGNLNTWPNQAYNADIKISPYVQAGTEQLLADLNFGSGSRWSPSSKISIVFDFKTDINPPIGIYRMLAFNGRGVNAQSFYSWTVEGSMDGQQWVRLDERKNILLSQNLNELSTFVLPSRGAFQYYRFQFSPSLEEDVDYSGLMELELYPVPSN